ncbi:MAG: beta-ketoacyl synthase [Desulfobacterales bacterium]|nr:beta-ketoacyl synthase [Desulfobacterales bacterium]
MDNASPIAIVGFSGVFPGASDPDRLWQRIIEKSDGICEIPPERRNGAAESIWSDAAAPDQAVSRRAGLIGHFDFDPEACRLGGALVKRLDPLHQLSLCVGHRAWESFAAGPVDKKRAGVILAAIALPTDSASRLCRDLIFGFLKRRIHKTSEISGFRPDAARAAQVTGLPAALVARELDLGGISFTLDAACASSLYALKLAAEELQSRRADVMLAGGVSRPDCLYTQVGFSQLKALSPSGRCAPFDASADGLVVGEGCGILVLKRLKDALAHGDWIWGVVRGIGLSNDMRGNLLAPDSGGQIRAMTAAYAQAGWKPSDVDLIECHGTGTPVGDRTEIESLVRLWEDSDAASDGCAIGSIKSTVGHLLVAAGAAGIIKSLIAMDRETLPPSLHFDGAAEGSPLPASPFHVQTEAAPWPRRAPDTPRRAAVSAFGFGGINAHVLLEEWMGGKGQHQMSDVRCQMSESAGSHLEPVPRIQHPASSIQAPIAIVGMDAAFGSAMTLEAFEQAVFDGVDLKRKRPAHRWKGIEDSLPDELVRGMDRGAYLKELAVGLGEFRIPPSELPDILPQHLVMLRTACRAFADAGLERSSEHPRWGAVVGIDFDHEATNFHLRWRLDAESRLWPQIQDIPLDSDAGRKWIAALQNACSPPLNANRTLGALAGVIGSRIAREFKLGGPSFTVSDGPGSCLRALHIAVGMLERSEADLMLVGAVDLAGDVRACWASAAQAGAAPPGEGAAAFVLKRLDQALIDEDRIYAVVRGVGSASGGEIGPHRLDSEAWDRSLHQALTGEGGNHLPIGLLEIAGPPEQNAEQNTHRRSPVLENSRSVRVERVFGNAGAASGAAALARAATCLARKRLPAEAPGIGSSPWREEKDGTPRRACVAATTAEGGCIHAILEEAGTAEPMSKPEKQSVPQPANRAIVLTVGGDIISVPAPPASPSLSQEHQETHPTAAPMTPEPENFASDPAPVRRLAGRSSQSEDPSSHSEDGSSIQHPASSIQNPVSGLGDLMVRSGEAAGRAHEKFLEFSKELHRAYADAVGFQVKLIDAAGQNGLSAAPPTPLRRPAPAYDRDLCMEFAIGSVEKVLGPEFAEVDRYPVRVRLPDEPLMLVDRILSVEGEKRSLSSGRVTTEHDVLPGAWYLDAGRAPVCISVEAGQADLFLCSYLGIDFRVKGRRAYRLLDATVFFHRGLPAPGDTIRYEIEIEKFVRQGDTWLFFFHFDGYVDDAPLITMIDGCAGFFTPQEVENSGGILFGEEKRRANAGRLPPDWAPPVPMKRESYPAEALSALRRGDARACFGERFAGVFIPEPLRLPGGRMHLIDRILAIDPKGGRYGIGSIRAEADIHPDDWFLSCHFVDDMVMPGTLMYECCAHTLRVFLQRMGWFTDSTAAAYEPKPGIRSVLKCRGPVTPATRHVVYEIEVKELGLAPFPYALADAHMFADGRRIVMFRDMSMQVSGIAEEEIDAFWRKKPLTGSVPMRPAPGRTSAAVSGEDPGPSAAQTPQKPSFSREQILAFAQGKPSEAFGPRFTAFDEDRFIARLPSPPYSFIDRVVHIEPPPQVMAPGGWVTAEFEVDPDAWYFSANRNGSMPFCVLQEAALQACGFTAAYVGSSLTSKKDSRFRNLGGEAVQHRDVSPDRRVLTTRCRLVRVSTAADMILQDFEMAVIGEDGAPIYEGTTNFGFFTPEALAQQAGIRHAEEFSHWSGSTQRHQEERIDLEMPPPLFPGDSNAAPVQRPALPAKALLMIDSIDSYLPDGGPHGLGFVRGQKSVDPQEWFFAAHFYQDPVWPGSLGLESLLQLLKFDAIRRFPDRTENCRFAPMLDEKHRWSYRGQILPSNREVTVEAAVTRIEEGPEPLVQADGLLRVDGVAIYKMENFGIRIISE